jgi:hypothetical protein
VDMRYCEWGCCRWGGRRSVRLIIITWESEVWVVTAWSCEGDPGSDSDTARAVPSASTTRTERQMRMGALSLYLRCEVEIRNPRIPMFVCLPVDAGKTSRLPEYGR